MNFCPDHPAAIVGLSNILLDIYSENLSPTAAIPPLENSESFETAGHSNTDAYSVSGLTLKELPCTPLGLGFEHATAELPVPNSDANDHPKINGTSGTFSDDDDDQLPAPYKATRLPLVDRLAARDRAYTLLSGLTRLGTGWDYSEAWFALARAYEESGQPDKAKEVLWWCIELEEAMGVRDWRSLASGTYIV